MKGWGGKAAPPFHSLSPPRFHDRAIGVIDGEGVGGGEKIQRGRGSFAAPSPLENQPPPPAGLPRQREATHAGGEVRGGGQEDVDAVFAAGYALRPATSSANAR